MGRWGDWEDGVDREMSSDVSCPQLQSTPTPTRHPGGKPLHHVLWYVTRWQIQIQTS